MPKDFHCKQHHLRVFFIFMSNTQQFSLPSDTHILWQHYSTSCPEYIAFITLTNMALKMYYPLYFNKNGCIYLDVSFVQSWEHSNFFSHFKCSMWQTFMQKMNYQFFQISPACQRNTCSGGGLLGGKGLSGR